MKQEHSNSGFTLIELMITVAIIGILAAIAVPSYTAYIKEANENAAALHAKTLASFEDNYFYENETYLAGTYTPGGANGLSALDWSPSGNDDFKFVVTAGACGDIAKCYSITVTLVSDPTINYTVTRP